MTKEDATSCFDAIAETDFVLDETRKVNDITILRIKNLYVGGYIYIYIPLNIGLLVPCFLEPMEQNTPNPYLKPIEF